MDPTADPVRVYLAAFVVLGAAAALLGPAVTQLREQTGSTVGAIAIAFTTQSLGYLVLSVLSGRWYDRGGGHRLLAAGLLALGVAGLGWPAASSVAAVALASGLVGAASAVVDVGGNTLLVWARPGGPGPALNALHLCFGLGALASPLLVDRSQAWTGGLWGAVVVIGATGAVAAVAVARTRPPRRPAPRPVAPGDRHRTPRAALAVFFVLYVGTELGFAGWVHTYAEAAGLTAAATGITAAFWAGFCLGRLAAIGLVRRLGEVPLLVGACALAVVAAAVLVVAAGGTAAVWVATVLFGLGVAPQFPTMIAVADRRLGVTGAVTSWIIGGAGLGSLTIPWLIGVLLDERGAQALPVTVLVSSVATGAWCVVLVTRVLPRPEPARVGVLTS